MAGVWVTATRLACNFWLQWHCKAKLSQLYIWPWLHSVICQDAATRANVATTALALVAASASSISALWYLRERRTRDCRKVHPMRHPFDVPIRFTLQFLQKVETQRSAGAQSFELSISPDLRCKVTVCIGTKYEGLRDTSTRRAYRTVLVLPYRYWDKYNVMILRYCMIGLSAPRWWQYCRLDRT